MKRHIAIAAVIALACHAALAQNPRSYQRQADGTVAWVPFKAETCVVCGGSGKAECATCNGGQKKLPARCLECRGKKKTACRQCAGRGKSWDSFHHYLCLRCEGKGFLACPLCEGRLRLRNADGTIGHARCRLCAKKGGWSCPVCGGKRLLSLGDVGGVPFEKAKRTALVALEKRLRSALDAANKYLEEGGVRAARIYPTIMDKVVAVAPEFKNEPKFCEKLWTHLLKKQRNLRDVKQYAGSLRAMSVSAGARAVAYRLGVVRNCLQLVEHNEKVARERKKKSGDGN